MNLKTDINSLPLWYSHFCRRVVELRAGRGKKRRSLSYLCGLVDGWIFAGLLGEAEGELLHAVIENARQYRGK